MAFFEELEINLEREYKDSGRIFVSDPPYLVVAFHRYVALLDTTSTKYPTAGMW